MAALELCTANQDSARQSCPPEFGSDSGDEMLPCDTDLEMNPFDGLPYSSRYYKLLQERKKLPVWEAKDAFMSSLVGNNFIILSGEACIGKSSQTPQWCAEYCFSSRYQYGVVVCTQTHKQTAVDLALRVADEMDVNIGHEVGYVIPYENCCMNETILRYSTDDMLLQEMMSNPLLEHYAVIIVDETHRRTISTDVLLGLLKDLVRQRPELKVVIITSPHMSSKLHAYYGDGSLIQVETVEPIECPFEIVYSCMPQENYFFSALRLLFKIHSTMEKGDVAIFLSCKKEIDEAYKIIERETAKHHPMLGELVPIPLDPEQTMSFDRPGDTLEQNGKRYKRKVILTTSVGKSLHYMENVKYVIDVGMERRSVYNPRIRAESLVMRPISKIQAKMRTQIIDSARLGKCFRLYSEEFLKKEMPDFSPACVLESNLTRMVLFLKRMDIADMGQCDFIERPAPEALMQALEDLDYLAALDDDGNLSEIGIIMSEFPLDPQMAKALVASCEYDCVHEMLTIAAMVTAPCCFLEPPPSLEEVAQSCRRKFFHPEGDHFTLINVYTAFKQSKLISSAEYSEVEKWCHDNFLNCSALRIADAIRADLLDIMQRIELPISELAFGTHKNSLNVKRALMSGYFMQTARDVDGLGNYVMLTHKHVTQLHAFSSYCSTRLKPEWVLFHEFTISENNCIRIISEVSPKMFVQLVPQYYFSNLPHSESKEILQEITDHLKLSTDGEVHHVTTKENDKPQENSTEDRCTIQ
ncbi:putative pre-mRNA-splicing factor ATP-dependent RNA helicase DHX32 isoform X1 [Hypanus sabinus]|uniref:putative pre-mRNA-splicing factor ATP-dependent RNA helicase DHX32 isoform X1 n=2 Tax=Hypanus sabinus TaxID=79690 RepID=UPI0028C4AD80|nr:putative pre-mRNA-splicing factor ATP-dependent RNA helicase DHX32 isoform X1 [Hypanus sabinus]